MMFTLLALTLLATALLSGCNTLHGANDDIDESGSVL